MPEKLGFHDAFAKLGTKPRNRRTAWAAISDDGKTVAVTVWKEEYRFNHGKPKCTYDGANLYTAGWKQRTECIQHAIDNCDGLVRVVLIEAKDSRKPGQRRQFKQVLRVFDQQWFRVRNFDPETGYYTLEMVS